MALILAFDQGTTSSRAILFDEAGSIRGVAQKEFTQHFPRPGWVEHDAQEIWDSQLAVARAVMKEHGVAAADIVAIGITNQRETTVIWDRRTGEPIHRAIVWQDRRTAGMCDALRKAGHAEAIADRTGLVIDAYFSGTKARWILDNVSGARERAERGELCFGTIDAWLIWKLTGGRVHATDASNASRTMLLNIRTGEWDDELCDLLAVPREVLPSVCDSSGVVGETDRAIFGRGIPIAGVAGDQQAALFGQACFSPGLAKNTYGTGCFLLSHVGDAPPPVSKHRMLTTIAWRIGGRIEYAMEGSVFIGGAVVQWLRDGLGVIESAAQIEPLAASVDDNGGVYFVPAFAGLGAPHWDAYARGTIVGLTRGTSKAHLARAALESIALQSADLADAMAADSGSAIGELRVDGGASANNLLMQMQADILQRPVVRPRVTETTALGAAYLAGLAAGYWRDRDQIAGNWAVDRRFDPRKRPEWAAEHRARWAEAVQRSKGWERSGDAT